MGPVVLLLSLPLSLLSLLLSLLTPVSVPVLLPTPKHSSSLSTPQGRWHSGATSATHP